MSTLKEDWKIVGKELGATFEDLGRAVFKTAKLGVQKLEMWIDEDPGKQDKE